MARPYPQIVLFGDSLMQRSVYLQDGFSLQAALQTRCIRRLDVINRGFSGWNTANAVKFLGDIFPRPSESVAKMDYLIILLGTNDAVVPLPTTSQHVPVEVYKENLRSIVTHPHVEAHKAKILLVTPPPVDEIKTAKISAAEGHPSATRQSAVSASYSERARELVRELAGEMEMGGLVLVDLWQALMDKAIALTPDDYQSGGPWLGSPENGRPGGLESLLPDGVHMSGEAYRVFYELIEAQIGPDLDAQPDDGRPAYVFPDWRALKQAGERELRGEQGRDGRVD